MSDYPTSEQTLPLFSQTPDAGGDMGRFRESAPPADGFSATNPIARSTDPITSHLAASQRGDKRAVQRVAMLQAFRTATAQGKALTAKEAARMAQEVCGGTLEDVRKRYCDLMDPENPLIYQCPPRKCLVTSKRANTYKAVQ